MDLKREIVEVKYQSRLWELIGDKDGTVNCLINYAKSFQTNHILIPAGSDFSFQFADLKVWEQFLMSGLLLVTSLLRMRCSYYQLIR